jgi:eukaryotic-like serine/threonine-protein kinase
MLPCPSELTLRSIGSNAISDDRYVAIEKHVEECPQCAAALERLVHAGLEAPDTLPNSEESPRIPGFEIRRELGRGAMSVVYRAWQPALKRFVTLKVVRSGPNAGARERGRWLREARAYACVRHPNIVLLHDAGESGPWLYLVLEYVPGGSLKHRLETPYAPTDGARLLETIARAVAAVHSANLVHLDLKPSNILLDVCPEKPREQATPRVGDFGIAYRWCDPDRSLPTESLSGPLGTPSYMAPEQIKGDRDAIGPPADIYGLGALLYHVLTGRPPFSAASVVETLEQVRNQEPAPPRRLNPQVPRDLETIALKCLAKHPAGRYVSAEAMADDLRRWLDGRPISARPVSSIEKVWRWSRRRPTIASLTAAIVLVVCIGFVAVVSLWRRAEAESLRARSEVRFAGNLFGEISAFGSPSSGQLRVVKRDDVILFLERTRKHILSQRMERPEDLVTLRQLSNVDINLAEKYTAEKKVDQARALLCECLEALDNIERQDPYRLMLARHRFAANCLFAEIADIEESNDEAITYIKRALAYGEEDLLSVPDHERIATVAHCRRSLAEFLSRQGNDDGARSVILANLRMLDDVPKDVSSPKITIWRTLVRIDLHQFKTCNSPTPASPPNIDGPLAQLASPEADPLDAETWAELVARSLSSGPAPIFPPDRHLCDFVDHLSERIAWQRRRGRLDEARRSAGRMHAFACLMVSRYPDHSLAHLAMCQALKQMAKNASRNKNDRAAVERNSQLAIKEARHALFLDPLDSRAANEVADLQKRLDAFLASEPGT